MLYELSNLNTVNRFKYCTGMYDWDDKDRDDTIITPASKLVLDLPTPEG